MKPWFTCVVGMMIGSLVLIWAGLFKPHTLRYQSVHNEKNYSLIQKVFDIQK